jgi:hypothetical protein
MPFKNSWVLFGVGPGARSASKSDPSPRIATHCIDELIVCPTRVTVGSRWGVKSQADSQALVWGMFNTDERTAPVAEMRLFYSPYGSPHIDRDQAKDYRGPSRPRALMPCPHLRRLGC